MFFPATCDTGIEHERTGLPSTWTVHAPHSPAPQPNFVPVSCSVSRRTQSRGVSGETFALRSPPFTRRVNSGIVASQFFCTTWYREPLRCVMRRSEERRVGKECETGGG